MAQNSLFDTALASSLFLEMSKNYNYCLNLHSRLALYIQLYKL